MSAGNMSVNKYHKKSSSMVKASAQKEVFEKIEPFLTEEEMAVYKRGRNSKSGSVAKNASMMDYRKATGVEALVGYLYLAGDMDRIIELIGIGFDLNKKEKDIIIKHMWPLTIIPPRYIESFIITLVDKYCALKESYNYYSGKVVSKKILRYASFLLLAFIVRIP